MRFIILGAGAVGGLVGFRLLEAGCSVVLVARGRHGEVIRREGMTLRDPQGVHHRPNVECVATMGEIVVTDDDVLILCVKSQDVEGALARVDPRLPVVCAQNGVVAEEIAARRFNRVYGMMTWTPAQHLTAGEVEVYAKDPAALFRIGRYPSGNDPLAAAIATNLAKGRFDAIEVADILRWKHAKLLLNLGNTPDAFGRPGDAFLPWVERAIEEGLQVLRAANRETISTDQLRTEMKERMGESSSIDGTERAGGSTWQSVALGKPNEVAYLNGWVCQLGDQIGVATPVNRAFVSIAAEATAPRCVGLDRLIELVREAEQRAI